MPTALVEELEGRRDQLKKRLVAFRDMRRGSLVERYRRCGKPNCHCAREDSVGHGPSFSLTHARAGMTVTRVIPAGSAVEKTREQLAEYRRFRQVAQEFVQVNEQLCDARLGIGPARAEKGGSKRSFRRRLSGRSKRS